MVGLAILVFAGLFVWSFAQMDSVNINNYIDSLKNGDNIFINIITECSSRFLCSLRLSRKTA